MPGGDTGKNRVVRFESRRDAGERQRPGGPGPDALAEIFRSIGVGVILADDDRRITWWNHEAERLLGAAGVDLSVEGWTRECELYLPDAVTPFPESDLPVDSGAVEIFVRDEAAPPGRWLVVEALPGTDGDGVPAGTAMMLRDVSRRKHAEDAVTHLTTAFDALPDAACTLSPDGYLLYVNQAAKSLFGVEEDEGVSGRHLREFFTGSDRQSLVKEAIPEANRFGIWRGEMNCVGQDGKQTRVSQVILAHNAGEEETLFLSMSMRDVSRTRRMQEDLNLLAAALAEAVDGIAFLDRKGRYVFVNDAYADMIGADRESLIRTQWLGTIHPDDLEHMKYAYRSMQEVGKAKAEARSTTGTEGVRHVEFVMSRAQGGGSGYAGCYFFAKDITKRKLAERRLADRAEELARSNAELEQFAYVASHDLQEPLRMVASFTQLLAQRYEGRLDGDADEFIRFAVDGVTRMQALIHDLLDYSRVGRHGRGFRPTPFREVFEGAVANLRKAVRESEAVVECRGNPTVLADPAQLVQLLQNLIGNAIKFRGEAGPEVLVDARPEGRMWLISVRDNGTGIAPEYLDRIFEIFQRLHTREEYPGTGIGLAISRKIVERHGGTIWAESAEGGGTVFRFTLPGASGAEHD